MPNLSPPRELEHVAVKVQRASHFASLAYLAADGSTHPDIQKAAKAARLASDAADAALTALAALGVRVGAGGQPVVPSSLPLELLNTSASRRFLSALEAAADAAEVMDRERGFVDSQGETIGASERLREWAALVRVETFGPQGLE